MWELIQIACLWPRTWTRTLLHAVTGSNFNKIFMIGDSYADIGNRDPNNHTRTVLGGVDQPWLPPYGRTNPTDHAGRFSNGKSLGDVLGMSLTNTNHLHRIR